MKHNVDNVGHFWEKIVKFQFISYFPDIITVVANVRGNKWHLRYSVTLLHSNIMLWLFPAFLWYLINVCNVVSWHAKLDQSRLRIDIKWMSRLSSDSYSFNSDVKSTDCIWVMVVPDFESPCSFSDDFVPNERGVLDWYSEVLQRYSTKIWNFVKNTCFLKTVLLFSWYQIPYIEF